jgi:hypothetical protein
MPSCEFSGGCCRGARTGDVQPLLKRLQTPLDFAGFGRDQLGWTLDEPDITNVLLQNDNVG